MENPLNTIKSWKIEDWCLGISLTTAVMWLLCVMSPYHEIALACLLICLTALIMALFRMLMEVDMTRLVIYLTGILIGLAPALALFYGQGLWPYTPAWTDILYNIGVWPWLLLVILVRMECQEHKEPTKSYCLFRGIMWGLLLTTLFRAMMVKAVVCG